MKKEMEIFELEIPKVEDGSELERKCALLKSLQFSLQMHFVKVYKGTKRLQKLKDSMFILWKANMFEAENLDKAIIDLIESEKQVLSKLPKEYLSMVNSLEDLFFGEYSQEAYKALKNYFCKERDFVYKRLFLQ